MKFAASKFKMIAMAATNYTFGDTERASARLRRLAELYEPETRELLQDCGVRSPHLAVDLGCGPGWSTRLLREVLDAERTVGLDASERYVAEARSNNGDARVEFEVHDVVQVPFPVVAPNVMLCRFLLTHLRTPGEVLTKWASVAAPSGLLIVHETESLETEHPRLRRYYELVARLQEHYGQTLRVGAVLEDCFANTGWRLMDSRRRVVERPARSPAELHLANLRTWRNDPFACRSFDPGEIDLIERSLERIVSGVENAGVVVNAARQIIAQRI
jgi:trans-aconitate 2-methyltransferase